MWCDWLSKVLSCPMCWSWRQSRRLQVWLRGRAGSFSDVINTICSVILHRHPLYLILLLLRITDVNRRLPNRLWGWRSRNQVIAGLQLCNSRLEISNLLPSSSSTDVDVRRGRLRSQREVARAAAERIDAVLHHGCDVEVVVEVVRLGMVSDVRRWRCLGAVDTGMQGRFLICGSFQIPSTISTYAIAIEAQHDRNTIQDYTA